MAGEAGRFRQARNRERLSEVGNQLTDSLIPVHWLHTHAYCEYQIYLEKVQGLEAPPTMEMIAGAKRHAILDEEHEKKAELDLTVSEAAVKAQLEEVSLISRDIFVKGTALYGRIDEVVFEPARIIIIDDKPSAQPYFTNKIQVWGYCQAFQEMYQPNLPLFGALRQEDTGDIVWLEEFLKDHAMLVKIRLTGFGRFSVVSRVLSRQVTAVSANPADSRNLVQLVNKESVRLQISHTSIEK